MSAQLGAAGIFPPTKDEIWNKQLLWQPIPIHALQRTDDHLLTSEKRCDRFDYVMLQYMNTTAYTDYFTKHTQLYRYLEENSGMELNTLTAMILLYDALYVAQLKDKPWVLLCLKFVWTFERLMCFVFFISSLPKWAEEVMIPGSNFEYLALSWYAIYSQTSEMQKLKSGFLLKKIMERFSHKINSTLSPNRSLWLYYAHDITITNMLSTLGFFKKASLFESRTVSSIFMKFFIISSTGASTSVRVLSFHGSLSTSNKWNALRTIFI